MKLLQYIKQLFKKREIWVYEKYLLDSLKKEVCKWSWTVIFQRQKKLIK